MACLTTCKYILIDRHANVHAIGGVRRFLVLSFPQLLFALFAFSLF